MWLLPSRDASLRSGVIADTLNARSVALPTGLPMKASARGWLICLIYNVLVVSGRSASCVGDSADRR